MLGADLRDADLSGADLTGALYVTQAQLNAAQGDAGHADPGGSWRGPGIGSRRRSGPVGGSAGRGGARTLGASAPPH